MARALALVVDRDPQTRSLIAEVLQERKITGLKVADPREAIEALKQRPVHLVFLHAGESGAAGEELIRHALSLTPPPLVVGLAAGAEGETGDRLLEAGLFDVVARPVEAAAVRRVVSKARRELELRERLSRLERELQNREGYRGLVGHSRAIEGLREQLRRLATVDLPVWFHGEQGTGKELAARLLHGYSQRSEGEFVVMDCAALARGGSERKWIARDLGPADEPVWKQAQGGTLLIDEIAELSGEGRQSLAELVAGITGSATPATRFLVASRRDPRHLIDRGELAETVYGRLAEHTIRIPPLRERAEDIPLLVRSFLSRIVEINHLPPLAVAPETMELLERYTWPGNVQELRNAVEHAAILASEGRLRPSDLPDRVRESQGGESSSEAERRMASRRFRDAKREVVESFERAYLCELMEQHGGNVTSAAVQAGMLRSALQRLLRKYGLKSVEFRKRARAGRARVGTAPRVD